MTGRKPLFEVSLPLLGLPPICALAADVKTHPFPRYLWYDDPSDDGALNGSVPFSGKAAFSR